MSIHEMTSRKEVDSDQTAANRKVYHRPRLRPHEPLTGFPSVTPCALCG